MAAMCAVYMSNELTVDTEKRIVYAKNGNFHFEPSMTGNKITVNDGSCMIDGFELVDGRWKRTFRAIWHNLI